MSVSLWKIERVPPNFSVLDKELSEPARLHLKGDDGTEIGEISYADALEYMVEVYAPNHGQDTESGATNLFYLTEENLLDDIKQVESEPIKRSYYIRELAILRAFLALCLEYGEGEYQVGW